MKIFNLVIIFCLLSFNINGQIAAGQKYTIRGTIYETEGISGKGPLANASITIEAYGLGTVSLKDGSYSLNNVPNGQVKLSISYVNKISIDTMIHVSRNMKLDFMLDEENFRLNEVTVIAENTRAGQSTASKISSNAMEHLQAVSLSDIMALLPGGITKNPTLDFASQINIRNISTEGANMNALGASIIKDGAPVSNNANLQTMHPSVIGGTVALSGGSSPGGGIDVRNIPVENIESVEVIRGIPSVEYGDLTSGAVIINSKAGKQPLQLKARTNPHVYQFSAQQGFELRGNKGALNLSADYANNTTNPVQSYLHYQRASAKAIYSNTFLNNKWRSNTSFDFVFGRDKRDLNPDDQVRMIASDGRTAGSTINTNGTIFLNKGILRNIKYVLSGSCTNKNSEYQENYTSATAPYSMTSVDGAIITNKPRNDLFDTLGQKITNWSGVNNSDYAQYLPSSYLGKQNINGREVNLYGKLLFTLFKRIRNSNNRILVGLDSRIDGNLGEGKTFSSNTPPYRNLQAVNASFRPRAYKEIPFLKQYSAYAEENFNLKINNKNNLNIQAGLRYDLINKMKGFLSPRVNGSLEIIQNTFFLRGGYGVTAKMPTLIYMYPERAYFEYININEMASTTIPENERIIMTTTRVFDTDNPALKIASNSKSEIGFDIQLKKMTLNVTAFKESLKNGYSMSPIFAPLMFNEYVRASASQQVYFLQESNPVLAKYFVPNNNLIVNTKGIEADLNIRRIESIRTSFSLNGAWLQSQNYSSDFTYFDDFSGIGGKDRTHIGLYEPAMSRRNTEQLNSALRIIHNIPQIGLVISLTTETMWITKDWYQFGNDTIPVSYISKLDGKIYPFDPQKASDPEFKNLLRRRDDRLYITESYPPLLNFNINLTKEIMNFMRVSFFANNFLRSYPLTELKRSPGTFTSRNKQFFFGLELNFLIK